MHGFKRTEEDDTERINNDRRIDERESLDKGGIDSLFDGGETCCSRLLVDAAAMEDLAFPVPLTKRGLGPDLGQVASVRSA